MIHYGVDYGDRIMVNYIQSKTGNCIHYDAWLVHHPEEALPICHWCLKHFGTGTWTMGSGKFYFDKEEDAMMFALRWCGI